MDESRKPSIEFFVEGVPRTKGSSFSFVNPKTGKIVYVHDNKHLKKWTAAVKFTALEKKCQPRNGPIWLMISYVLPRPKSHFNTIGDIKEAAPVYPLSKPDVDKMERAILDSLTGVAYCDDSQVVHVSHGKSYTQDFAEVPGVRIRVMYDPEFKEAQELTQMNLTIKGGDDF